MLELGKPKVLQDGGNLVGAVFFRDVVNIAYVVEKILTGEMLKQQRRLQYRSYLLLDCEFVGFIILQPLDENLTLFEIKQAGENANEGTFPAPFGPISPKMLPVGTASSRSTRTRSVS